MPKNKVRGKASIKMSRRRQYFSVRDRSLKSRRSKARLVKVNRAVSQAFSLIVAP